MFKAVESFFEKTADTPGPQGLKVMSSIPITFPQSPDPALLISLITTVVVVIDVLNTVAYSFHSKKSLSEIAPVSYFAKTSPVSDSTCNVIFGSRPFPPQDIFLNRFVIHTPI